MKTETQKTVVSILAEFVVYGFLVVIYFFLVLHYLGNWFFHLEKENVKLYAAVCIGLMIGQAVVLEWVTTFIFRLLRGRSQ